MVLRVGTHTSIAKWPELAFERSAAVWWNTLQIFAKSPRGWSIPSYSEEQFTAGKQLRKEHGQLAWLVHSNYLANLSKAEDEIGKEIDSIVHDFELAYKMWYEAVNVHVGKLKWRDSLDEAMINMVKNVEKVLKRVRDAWRDSVQFLFENTAGQGSEIGSTLDELAYFYTTYLKDLPVKFTIDTAHCRGGGIDLAQRDLFLEEFDEKMWIEQLHSIHLNDAKVILWSHLDRHASLGQWFIWWPVLSQIVSRAAKHKRPLYIETPQTELRSDEIEQVKNIAAWKTDWIEEFHATHFQTHFLKKFDQYRGEKGLF